MFTKNYIRSGFVLLFAVAFTAGNLLAHPPVTKVTTDKKTQQPVAVKK